MPLKSVCTHGSASKPGNMGSRGFLRPNFSCEKCIYSLYREAMSSHEISPEVPAEAAIVVLRVVSEISMV